MSDNLNQISKPTISKGSGTTGSPTGSPWSIRPLTRTRRDNGQLYTREAEVERQIQRLCQMPERLRREKLRNPIQRTIAWEDEARLREETLVYFIREYSVYGDADTAWELVEVLTERVAAHIQRKLGRWRLSVDDAEDCTRDLLADLCEALFDTTAPAEFWEVRFWVCLDRRLWNLIEKRQHAADSELSPGDQEIESEDSKDADRLIAQIADTAPRPDEMAEWSQARSILSDNEWLAVYLVYGLGYPEESESPERTTAAKVMGVTGRSIRNYLKRARQKLMEWYQGEGTVKSPPGKINR